MLLEPAAVFIGALRFRERFIALSFLLFALPVAAVYGESVSTGSVPESPKAKTAETRSLHRFWDRENDFLFAGVGAARTLDYFSTLNMRRRGRQEILLTNDVVDNHAAFAAIEAGGTGASILGSFVFHHYGHHKLERWVSVVHFGLATGGAVRNYCLKTAHSSTPTSAGPLGLQSSSFRLAFGGNR